MGAIWTFGYHWPRSPCISEDGKQQRIDSIGMGKVVLDPNLLEHIVPCSPESKKKVECWEEVSHIFNPSNWEAEVGRSQLVQGQLGLKSKSQD